jgi:ribonuclease BN (tRNA processing enzyme)
MLKSALILLFSLMVHAMEVQVQILGSGGPEISERASSGALVWIDGKSRLLIDCGGGCLTRFAQSGGVFEDLDAILLTHTHIDHTADLSALMKAGFFTSRTRPITVYGPEGGGVFPSTELFITRLFGSEGAYAYMADMLTPKSRAFQILGVSLPHELTVMEKEHYSIRAMGVHHGPVPALAYRIDAGSRSIVFTGDTNNQDGTLERFAKNADIMIADFAIAEAADEIAKTLHMQPSVIAASAEKSGVTTLVLSHIMKRSEARIQESLAIIKQSYRGRVIVAEDLMRVTP